jgi:P-type Ca2+ transporter type 2C
VAQDRTERLAALRDTRGLEGLSSAEARARLLAEGPNEVPSAKRRRLAAIAREVLGEPMVLLLLASGVIYLILGDRRDAAVLLGSIVVVLGITLFQSHRTERALERLRDLASPRARVIRDSAQARIAGREVVRGDLLIVSEGDRVAADGKLLWQSNLTVDESLLTGESVPVSKRTAAEPEPGVATGGSVFSGTLVVSGQGLAEVTATGAATEMGKIGKSLGTIATEKTPLQRETRRIVRRLGIAGLTVCALVVIFYARARGDFLQGLLAGLAVAMSVLPEEFPVVLTVFLAIGAWRISRKKVLTRRIPAIEALGAATVLCVDKTGTLTLNRMAVTRLATARELTDVSEAQTLPEELHELAEFAVLSSQKTPFDPMELAIREFGLRTLARTEHLHDDWELLKEYPLSPALLAVSHAWKARNRGDFVIAAKGAMMASFGGSWTGSRRWRATASASLPSPRRPSIPRLFPPNRTTSTSSCWGYWASRIPYVPRSPARSRNAVLRESAWS